jgi:hypothetical protein
MIKHTILFLAANPKDTSYLALDREARAIQGELERSGYRDCFVLETRWAVEPLDLLHELRELKPTLVHYCGHNSQNGLRFQGVDGGSQVVSPEALQKAFRAAGASVRVVVLSSCYTEPQAQALAAHIDCVIGMSSSFSDSSARSFAAGFYGALGARESVGVAFEQGLAAVDLQGLPHSDRPQLKVRRGVEARQLVLAASPPVGSSVPGKTRRARAPG